MASSDKCPRCECEGNKLACEMCYYFGFKCPGNCACCADKREAIQRHAKVRNINDQRTSGSKISLANCQRPPTQRRTPLRPLILRNCTRASNQKKASSNTTQVKVGNSTSTESNITGPQVNSAVNVPNSNKVEPEIPTYIKQYVQKENEEYKRLWNRLFWPQWEKVPCEPQNAANQNTDTNNITIEKIQEATTELIGDHCLNCHCRNPRDSCDICRRCDYQCLGSCRCCLPYRAGQRYMVFITRGIFQLSDGSFYGGGSVNRSYTVPDHSENQGEENTKAEKKSFWARIMQAIQANIYLTNKLVFQSHVQKMPRIQYMTYLEIVWDVPIVSTLLYGNLYQLSKAVTASAISAVSIFIFITLNRNKTHLPEMLTRMRNTMRSYF